MSVQTVNGLCATLHPCFYTKSTCLVAENGENLTRGAHKCTDREVGAGDPALEAPGGATVDVVKEDEHAANVGTVQVITAALRAHR